MSSATLFGHRDFDYSPYRDKIRAIIIDGLCAESISDLKTRYHSVKNIMVLSYHDPKDFVLPKYFDESVYLLERRVPPRYAISYTNQEMILRADFVISGVFYHFGGAYAAWKFARQKKKIILDILEDVY